jgi:hypothetical protein
MKPFCLDQTFYEKLKLTIRLPGIGLTACRGSLHQGRRTDEVMTLTCNQKTNLSTPHNNNINNYSILHYLCAAAAAIRPITDSKV